jgi:PPOX class probable FMN-dependent enzyme
MAEADPYQIATLEELRVHYDAPNPLILRSKLDFLHDHMLQYMRFAPIVCIASDTEAGLDASPRGGEPGFIKPIDRKTLAFADWPGNNKMETFSNVITSGRIGMLFMAPQLDVFMRVNGPAIVTRAPAILDKLVEQGKTPKAAVKVTVHEAYFHCGKAFRRSALWKPDAWPDTSAFPSVGKVLSDMAKITEMSVEQLDAFYNHGLEHELY